MAEIGDFMQEFHRLPAMGKIAVVGGVAALGYIAWSRYQQGQSNTASSASGQPTGFGEPGTFSVAQFPPTTGTSSTTTPTPTPTPVVPIGPSGGVHCDAPPPAGYTRIPGTCQLIKIPGFRLGGGGGTPIKQTGPGQVRKTSGTSGGTATATPRTMRTVYIPRPGTGALAAQHSISTIHAARHAPAVVRTQQTLTATRARGELAG